MSLESDDIIKSFSNLASKHIRKIRNNLLDEKRFVFTALSYEIGELALVKLHGGNIA